VNLNIGVLWIGVLFVGILEEIPFRGFLLQKLQNRTGFLTANIITTVMFIVIHYPIWVSTGTNILQTSLALSFISFILGYLFKEFDSLWLPIICHSVFNMSIWIGLK
jgi:membrane protease YdiL (CAAX protease family)